LYLFQYPLRPAWRPYGLEERCQEIRVRPLQSRVEVDLAIDTTDSSYDHDSADNLKQTTQTLTSSQLHLATNYAVGMLQGDQLHLNPLHAVVQLRPSLDYLDSAADKAEGGKGKKKGAGEAAEEEEMGDGEDGEAGPVALEVSLKKRETEEQEEMRLQSYAHIHALREKEPWQQLQAFSASREEAAAVLLYPPHPFPCLLPCPALHLCSRGSSCRCSQHQARRQQQCFFTRLTPFHVSSHALLYTCAAVPAAAGVLSIKRGGSSSASLLASPLPMSPPMPPPMPCFALVQPWQQLQAFSASSEEAAAVRARMLVGGGGAGGEGGKKQGGVKKEEGAMEVDGAVKAEKGQPEGERERVEGGGAGVGPGEGVVMDGEGEEAAGAVADVPFTLPQYVPFSSQLLRSKQFPPEPFQTPPYFPPSPTHALFIPSPDPLPTTTPPVRPTAAYVQALVGSCLSHSSAAAAEIRGISGLSKSYLDSLPLERRLLALLSRAKTHIFQFDRLMNLLPAGTQQQQVLALLQHKALLVQGCWVAPSSMRCPVGPTCVLRDLLLLLFTKHRVIRQEHVAHLKVPKELLRELLLSIGIPRGPNTGWEFAEPTDQAFLDSHPAIAKEQLRRWMAAEPAILRASRALSLASMADVAAASAAAAAAKAAAGGGGAGRGGGGRAGPGGGLGAPKAGLAGRGAGLAGRGAGLAGRGAGLGRGSGGPSLQAGAVAGTAGAAACAVATSINGIYFLPTLNDPEVDPFREVVIALLRAKGAGGVGLKRTEIVEATRIALKAQVPAATYQRVSLPSSLPVHCISPYSPPLFPFKLNASILVWFDLCTGRF
ncbi:unnamed protein product, partial [Closterium sp. NIES-65]